MSAQDRELPPFIAERLLIVAPDGKVILLGGRERAGQRIVFPLPADDARFELIELPRTGSLWSWTVQRFRPKSPPYAGPEAFEPYAVGYVMLGDAIIVEGRLTGSSFDALHIGMSMEVVAERFLLPSGAARVTYAFAPAEQA